MIKKYSRNIIRVSKSFDLNPNYLQRLLADDTSRKCVNDIVSIDLIFFYRRINLNCDFVEASKVICLPASEFLERVF